MTSYIVDACDILNFNVAKFNRRRIYHDSIREFVQKYVKNSKTKKIKASYKTDDDKYKCPKCQQKVVNLQCAHVGDRHTDIINRIIDENPDMSFEDMIMKDIEHHLTTVKFAIVCSKCNTTFENKRSKKSEVKIYTESTSSDGLPGVYHQCQDAQYRGGDNFAQA
tara:strand:- start:337 stop:831 length:495 start_codon:yes stop_codon:yes gene_type:complete